MRTVLSNGINIALVASAIACSPAEKPLSQVSLGNKCNTAQIVGGRKVGATNDLGKEIVAIYNIVEGSLCTGSILNETTILTAAHCLTGDASEYLIAFDYDLTSGPPQTCSVNAIKAHPKYQAHSENATDNYDIGLLHLSSPIPEGYHPAQVLESTSDLVNGAEVILAGYGTTRDTQSIHDGSGILRKVSTKILNASLGRSEVELDQTDGKGACHGDSGGPAYIKVDGQLKLWGITSRGSRGCKTDSIYTKIKPYQSWIHDTLNQW